MIYLKSHQEINILKESGKILSSILKYLGKYAKPGIKLEDLDIIAKKMASSFGAYPTFLNYKPSWAEKAFPASICTSLNNVVVHGIPNNRKLKSGDILKIDMGITYKGMITDSAITVGIGNIKNEAKKLIKSTKLALYEGIKEAAIGNNIGDIGYAISKRAKKDGFFVLKELTGHGVGYELHEDPPIFNFGKKGIGEKIVNGMVIAIEPMFSTSSEEIIELDDESYATKGGGITAHFEHTIAIIDNSTIILTE